MNYKGIARSALIASSIFLFCLVIRWALFESTVQPETNNITVVLGAIFLISLIGIVILEIIWSSLRSTKYLKCVGVLIAIFFVFIMGDLITLRSIYFLAVNNYISWQESVNSVILKDIVEDSFNILLFVLLSFHSSRLLITRDANTSPIMKATAAIISIISIIFLILNTVHFL